MNRYMALLLSGLFLFFTACSARGGEVTLKTEQERYPAGTQEITCILGNYSPEAIVYGKAFYLEQKRDG